MTYIGTDRHINILSSQNGIDWGRRITLGEKAEEQSTVAIAPAGSNKFTIAWTGTDSDHHVNNMHGLSVDATGHLSAGTKIVLNERSAVNAGPALASDADMLYLAWTGTDGSLNFMRSGDFGVSFLGKLTFEGSRKDCGPALSVDNSGVICVGWTGTG
jgi:hypothetical protein